jgi:formamidopyrimidine-DNA glycosylase
LKRVSARQLARRLKGRRFESSHRHGKHLFVRTGDELWLRLHFGMTGWLQYLKRDEETPNTARVLFGFANNRRLAFDDQRKFGEVELIKNLDEFLQRRGIGPDALDVGLSEFKTIFRMHRGAVKAILLNQQLIAGIGNLYTDEILFRVRIHPATAAASLSDKDLQRLFRATGHVLERAIALKTDFNCLPKSWLLTNRGKQGRCPRCGRALKSATIGGRTSWFCGHCQKLSH